MNFFKFFGFLSIILCVIRTVSSSGNYEFTYRAIEVSIPNDDKFLNLDKFKIKRTSHDEPHKLYGNFTLFHNFTTNVELLGELYAKQGGEFRKTPYKLKQNFCKTMEADTVFYPSLAAAIIPPYPEKCDIPAGNYYLNGYMPDTSNTPPVVASGDYMIDVQFLSENGKLLQGFKVYFHIINSKGGLVGLM